MDITLQRILFLLGEKHGNVKKLADAIGMGGGTITNWKSGISKSYTKTRKKTSMKTSMKK